LSDLTDRLKKRMYPNFHLGVVGAAGCAAAVAAPMPQVTYATTIGAADKDMVDAVAEIERLQEKVDEATRLVRDIHGVLKRGRATEDHGLIGNLKCILDSVCRKYDPPPA
jgi:hypothetical protein